MKFSFKALLYFRVEPFLFILLVGLIIRGVTFNQMIQDKICKNVHNQSDNFCRDLASLSSDDPQFDIKTSVLVEFSHFNMYYTALSFGPSVIANLVLGSWCDKYRPGRKILLFVSTLGITIETVIQSYVSYNFILDYRYSLFGAIPSAIGGGIATAFIAVYSYIPATTPQYLISIRYMLAEVLLWLASPLSTVLGGFLLNYNIGHPIGGNGQLLNYQLVNILSAVFTLLAFLWVLFLVNEKHDKINLQNLSQSFELPVRPMQSGQYKKQLARPLDSIIEEQSTKNPFILLCDCDNIKDMIKTATKKRKNRGRLQLWLIIMSFVFVGLSSMGPLYIMFPFAEAAYLWDSKTFSILNSVYMILNSFGILLGTLILSKGLKFDDIPMAIFGLSAFLVSSVIRATFISSLGFWTSTLIGCSGGTANIGIRTYLSKIVNQDELGKVFSLISCIDGSIPFVGNIFFAMIFTHTLDTFPGAVFDVSGGLLFIPMTALIYIDVFCRKGSDKVDYNRDNRNKDQYINKNNEQMTYRTTGRRGMRQISTEL